MILKSNAKFEEKLACCFENDKNFANFHQSTGKCQNWKFDKIFLSKVENVFKRNWLVVLKLTRASQILTRALEKSKKFFYFNWLLVTKVYFVWATKVQKSYLSWHWGVMQILKKDWPMVWKKTWEIWQIFTRALETVKIGTLMGSFCPK